MQPIIIVLTEHDMKNEQIDRLHLNNFTVNDFYSRTTAPKGGVMILSKLGVKWKKLKVSPAIELLKEDKQFEFCCSI